MRLSLQLYTVRDAMASDIDGTLAAIRKTGLEYVELAGYYGKTAAEFAAILTGHGFRVSGAHTGLEAMEQSFEQVVQECKAFDNEWVIVPYLSDTRRDWPKFADTLNEQGAKLAAEGLKLAYHNHDFELGYDQGLRTLIANTDPSLVSFQIDLGWVRYAGEDPAKFLREAGARAPLVHLKDMAPDRENPHVVAGDGQVDWDATLAACKEVGVQFGVIEMDRPPSDPIGDTISCIKYFQTRGFNSIRSGVIGY